jgi:putative peptide zinc metalloprotease protein
VIRTRRDDSTRDLLRSRLTLREDVRFWPERYGERIWYHIEHREAGRFFRVGLAEYTFMSLLDGETSLGEAVSLTACALGPDALTEQQATTIALWLLDSNLASATDAPAKSSEANASRRLTEKLNPFWIKLPIGNPDRLLDALSPWLGWIHAGPTVVISFCLWMAAAVFLVGHWDSFSAASTSIFAPANWLYLTATWIGLKVVHELSHALACKRHGGSVRETGLIFILPAPMAFVDVTSSIRFRSKWQRIQVSAGGMYVELTLAAIAILLWGQIDSPVLKHVLHNIVIMASLSTILFNANPLMRFDGYYILSDLLQIPNLYQRGSDFLKRLGKGLVLGIPQPAVKERGLRAHFVRVYGVAAFCWRMLICAGLLIAASAMFEGLGILLALAGIVAWFGKPAWKMLRLLADLRQLNPRMFFRTATMSTLAAGLLAGVFFFTPWPGGRVAPGYVEFRDS